jgi:hypothetical protein
LFLPILNAEELNIDMSKVLGDASGKRDMACSFVVEPNMSSTERMNLDALKDVANVDSALSSMTETRKFGFGRAEGNGHLEPSFEINETTVKESGRTIEGSSMVKVSGVISIGGRCKSRGKFGDGTFQTSPLRRDIIRRLLMLSGGIQSSERLPW